MTTPTKLIVNCKTGEETILELTAEEIAQLEIDVAEAAAHRAAAEAEAAAVAEAKTNAQAKLTALGLTAEEITALTK